MYILRVSVHGLFFYFLRRPVASDRFKIPSDLKQDHTVFRMNVFDQFMTKWCMKVLIEKDLC